MQQTVKRATILDYSLVAAMKWVEAEFLKYSNGGRELGIFPVTGPSMLRQIPRQTTQDGKPSRLSYPFLLWSLGDLSLDTARGGLNKRMGRDILISKDIDKNLARMANLRPLKVGIGVSFNTSDYNDVLTLSHALLLNAPAISFYMDMKVPQFPPIGIRLNISESLTAPPVNIETPGEAYQFETVLTIDTFIGVEFEQRLIRDVVFRVVDPHNDAVFFNGDPSDDVDVLVKRHLRFTDHYDESNIRYRDRDDNS